ncbi:unnamed protein product [Mytilus coruscus]|uniref:Uncharacterized protein n=1 Tax=Mytilus coruscus TaxID=42192 RepID=A0A6J8E1P8_MYTCO|nr:unnamed protein product [Mytilus coruscus]
MEGHQTLLGNSIMFEGNQFKEDRIHADIKDNVTRSKEEITELICKDGKKRNDDLKEYINDSNRKLIGVIKDEFNNLFANIPLSIQHAHEQGIKQKIEVKVESSLLNEDKAVEVLSQDGEKDEKEFQIESIERKCLLLELKASPSIFHDEHTLRYAIRSLIERIAKAGSIDTSISSTITAAFSFIGPLENGEEDVIRRMVSNCSHDEKEISMSRIHSYSESESDSDDEYKD